MNGKPSAVFMFVYRNFLVALHDSFPKKIPELETTYRQFFRQKWNDETNVAFIRTIAPGLRKYATQIRNHDVTLFEPDTIKNIPLFRNLRLDLIHSNLMDHELSAFWNSLEIMLATSLMVKIENSKTFHQIFDFAGSIVEQNKFGPNVNYADVFRTVTQSASIGKMAAQFIKNADIGEMRKVIGEVCIATNLVTPEESNEIYSNTESTKIEEVKDEKPNQDQPTPQTQDDTVTFHTTENNANKKEDNPPKVSPADLDLESLDLASESGITKLFQNLGKKDAERKEKLDATTPSKKTNPLVEVLKRVGKLAPNDVSNVEAGNVIDSMFAGENNSSHAFQNILSDMTGSSNLSEEEMARNLRECGNQFKATKQTATGAQQDELTEEQTQKCMEAMKMMKTQLFGENMFKF